MKPSMASVAFFSFSFLHQYTYNCLNSFPFSCSDACFWCVLSSKWYCFTWLAPIGQELPGPSSAYNRLKWGLQRHSWVKARRGGVSPLGLLFLLGLGWLHLLIDLFFKQKIPDVLGTWQTFTQYWLLGPFVCLNFPVWIFLKGEYIFSFPVTIKYMNICKPMLKGVPSN